MAKQKFGKRDVINAVIKKSKKKRTVAQITIKIDSELDDALSKLSRALYISKNRLIEEVLMESGIIDEVEENYHE